ncbi:MAG: hypothetical protein WBX25_30790, partial [Rhodomicrobium sp.]
HCRLRMVNQEVFIDGLAERPQTGERHRLSPSRASASHNESANNSGHYPGKGARGASFLTVHAQDRETVAAAVRGGRFVP